MSDLLQKTYGRFEFKRDPSNDMLLGPEGCHYETEAKAMYYDQLGFCGCGDPEGMHKFVCECLEVFDRDSHREKHGQDAWQDAIKALKAKVAADPETAAYFIAYTLDKVHLTEHGGSVGGSWLTDRGKQFLEIGPMVEEEGE